jgi:hypothetical protein
MREQLHKAPDFNWVTILLGLTPIRAKKYGVKMTRTVAKVYRFGSSRAQARTRGTSNVDDTTLEFDWMGAQSFLRELGVSDVNPLELDLVGKQFEITEDIRDPEPNLAKSAGGLTNVLQNCEVISFEWSHEATEKESSLMVGISILSAKMAKGDLGGGGVSFGS